MCEQKDSLVHICIQQVIWSWSCNSIFQAILRAMVCTRARILLRSDCFVVITPIGTPRLKKQGDNPPQSDQTGECFSLLFSFDVLVKGMIYQQIIRKHVFVQKPKRNPPQTRPNQPQTSLFRSYEMELPYKDSQGKYKRKERRGTNTKPPQTTPNHPPNHPPHTRNLTYTVYPRIKSGPPTDFIIILIKGVGAPRWGVFLVL